MAGKRFTNARKAVLMFICEIRVHQRVNNMRASVLESPPPFFYHGRMCKISNIDSNYHAKIQSVHFFSAAFFIGAASMAAEWKVEKNSILEAEDILDGKKL